MVGGEAKERLVGRTPGGSWKAVERLRRRLAGTGFFAGPDPFLGIDAEGNQDEGNDHHVYIILIPVVKAAEAKKQHHQKPKTDRQDPDSKRQEKYHVPVL
jgi:hypothetical protein